MAISKFVKSDNSLPSVICEIPPIPFVSKAKNTENVDGANMDKTEFIKLEFLMDPSNPASKYACHFVIFKGGCAEEWVNWLMAYHEIESLMPLKKPADNSKMLRTLLKGQALSYLEHALRKRLDVDNDLLELVIRDIGLEYIPRQAIRVQKYYMRRGLLAGPNTSVQQFVERLNDLNRYLYLLYFPEENTKANSLVLVIS
jgi:hypothetical protein